ncbi:MAG: hypothetical protein ACYCXF_04255 [Thermoleophilia bacterium]
MKTSGAGSRCPDGFGEHILKKALIMIAVAALAIPAAWYGVAWMQLMRADSLMADANDAIARADEQMSLIGIGDLGASSFTSLDNINRAGTAVNAAQPLLAAARTDMEQVRDDTRRARGLGRLPDWYYNYLGTKDQIAGLRLQQLDRLQQTTAGLSALYESGPVIFSGTEKMDRLLGQFQAAMGRLPSDPAQARESLDQIAADMRRLQAGLDAANAQHAFQLLTDLSGSVAGNIHLVEQSADLAAATAAGDQAHAQQSAIALEKILLGTSGAGDFLNNWWRREIQPLQHDFADLQSQQEELDRQAAAIYDTGHGT